MSHKYVNGGVLVLLLNLSRPLSIELPVAPRNINIDGDLRGKVPEFRLLA